MLEDDSGYRGGVIGFSQLPLTSTVAALDPWGKISIDRSSQKTEPLSLMPFVTEEESHSIPIVARCSKS